ncbi:MAG: pectate lyase, partial [Streptomyces sp.]|nr:pectate lyase [Streptomyces sp.]
MRRLSAALLAGACLLLGAPQAQAADADRTPVGWGAGTTGGAGGTTWTVHTRAELKDALAATGPKVIRVVGSINGHEADDGSLLGEQDYAPGYDLAKYMSCFGEDGATWSDTRHDYCKQQRQSRQTGSNKEKAQIQLTVPSDTTLVGVGENA